MHILKNLSSKESATVSIDGEVNIYVDPVFKKTLEDVTEELKPMECMYMNNIKYADDMVLLAGG